MSSPQHLKILVAFLGSAGGRDKLNRFIAYFSKYLIHTVKTAADADKDLLAKLQSLNKHVGTARKLMRCGKWLEMISNLLEVSKIADPLEKGLTITKNTGLALWLYYDMWQLFSALGVWKDPAPEVTKRLSGWWWLLGLGSGLALTYYQLMNTVTTYKAIKKRAGDSDKSAMEKLKQDMGKHKTALVKGTMDIMLPLDRLDLTPSFLHSGYIGLLGTTTSVMGIQEEWKKATKSVQK